MAIYFYSTTDEFGCFSNFSRHGFELDGDFWKTSEHYFQAQKFEGLAEHYNAIRDAKRPNDAARMGRSRKRPLRKDWESVKDDVMRRAVLQKFTIHEDIRELLLSTEGEELVEDATHDYYWGCGKDGSGKNMLGRILMEVRDQLSAAT